MLTLIVLDNGEQSVNQLTCENLWREIKDIPGSQMITTKDWFSVIDKVTNKFVCFVESDCLVSSGYFNSMMGHIKKNAGTELNKMAILSSATAVNNWAVKFYGYNITGEVAEGVVPNKNKKSNNRSFYTVQVAYVPGSIIRLSFLQKVIGLVKPKESWKNDLVYLSSVLSLGFWENNLMVYIAPNSTYCTTEDYVNDIANIDFKNDDLEKKFHRESI